MNINKKLFFLFPVSIISIILLSSVILMAVSLWNDNGNLYRSGRMLKVGDQIKIIFDEELTVRYRMKTQDNESSALSGSTPNSYLSFLPAPAGDHQITYTSSSHTENKGSLASAITVSIAGVQENGNLNVSGTHTIRVNNEYQTLGISGIIAPSKIIAGNRVYSSDVQDAQIEYKSYIIKPQKFTVNDFERTEPTYITNKAADGTQTVTEKPGTLQFREDKQDTLIIEYLNKIMSLLFLP